MPTTISPNYSSGNLGYSEDDEELSPIFTPEQEQKWSNFATLTLFLCLVGVLALLFYIRF